MKRQTVWILATVVSVGALVPVWAQREKTREATSPESMARQLGDDLREARGLLDRVLSARGGWGNSRESGARDREIRRDGDNDRRRLELLLEGSERNARELEREIARLREQSYSQYGDRNRNRPAMRDSDFDQIVFAVRRARTASDEMRIVRQVAMEQWITARQLRDLIQVVDQPKDQEETAYLLYPRLTDPSRFYTIRDGFKSSSSWESVCWRLGIR